MKTVKILKDSIKSNPNAFSTCTVVPAGKKIIFKVYDNTLPDFINLEQDCIFIGTEEVQLDHRAESNDAIVYEYELANQFLLDVIYEWGKSTKKLKSLSIDIKYNKIYHMPESQYFYKYEKPLIKCLECNKKTRLNDIKETEDCCNVCPNCNAVDSFEEIKYEKLKT